jgi:phosphoglycerate dehydrogenase-like enzyme
VIANVLHKKDGEYAEILRAGGFDVRFPELGHRQLIEPELAATLAGVAATIAGSEPYTAAILADFPELRVISRTGVGFDAIDLAAARDRRVAIGITPGANHDAVAEQAFALLLGIARRVPQNHANVAGGGFERRVPEPVRGRTIGIVGFGRTGRAMAERALAFGMTVIAYDPYPVAPAPGVRIVDLDEILASSDYLSLHAPMTPETAKLVRTETIARMKPSVRIVNTARGGLIDEADLAAALASGRVAGAALDVFADEPPVGSPLLGAPNTVFSPHLAGIDATSCAAMGAMAAQTIVDLYHGRFPAERVANAAELPGWKW